MVPKVLTTSFPDRAPVAGLRLEPLHFLRREEVFREGRDAVRAVRALGGEGVLASGSGAERLARCGSSVGECDRLDGVERQQSRATGGSP